MQIKIVIGTIAFMIAMMVLGYSALREPSRMERFTNAELGRSIEAGAEIFTNNCATCHGVDGTAQECYDAVGNQIACQGLPLNYNGLLCGDVSQRMADMGWKGTKHDYILTTVAAGRGSIMPTWAEQFGGPLRPDQVQNVTNFVLNYESETLCSQPLVTYEWPEFAEEFLAGPDVTPPGDPARGEELYTVTYGCSACHGTMDGATTFVAAPGRRAEGPAPELPDVVEVPGAPDVPGAPGPPPGGSRAAIRARTAALGRSACPADSARRTGSEAPARGSSRGRGSRPGFIRRSFAGPRRPRGLRPPRRAPPRLARGGRSRSCARRGASNTPFAEDSRRSWPPRA